MSMAAAAAALGSFELIVCPPGPIGLLSLTYGDDGLPFCMGAGEDRACCGGGDCAVATSDGILELIFPIDSLGFGAYFSIGGFSASLGLVECFAPLTPSRTSTDGISNAMLCTHSESEQEPEGSQMEAKTLWHWRWLLTHYIFGGESVEALEKDSQ